MRAPSSCLVCGRIAVSYSAWGFLKAKLIQEHQSLFDKLCIEVDMWLSIHLHNLQGKLLDARAVPREFFYFKKLLTQRSKAEPRN